MMFENVALTFKKKAPCPHRHTRASQASPTSGKLNQSKAQLTDYNTLWIKIKVQTKTAKLKLGSLLAPSL